MVFKIHALVPRCVGGLAFPVNSCQNPPEIATFDMQRPVFESSADIAGSICSIGQFAR